MPPAILRLIKYKQALPTLTENKNPMMKLFKPSQRKIEERKAREEAALTPPSKVLDASTHAQHLVQIIRYKIEAHLGSKEPNLKAAQMITREYITDNLKNNNKIGGTIYYVKVQTENKDWPWIFVKIYEPPIITGVPGFRVRFMQMKKMDQEYKLVTF